MATTLTQDSITTAMSTAFTKSYYAGMDDATQRANLLATLYDASSAVLWHGKPFQGVHNPTENNPFASLLQELPPTKHTILALDHQPLPVMTAYAGAAGGAVPMMVNVHGLVRFGIEPVEHAFTQQFILVPSGKAAATLTGATSVPLVIQSDHYRLI